MILFKRIFVYLWINACTINNNSLLFFESNQLSQFFLSRSCSNINIQRLLLEIYLYAAIVNCRNNFKGMLSEENTLPSPTKLTMTGRLNFFASTPPIKHGLIVMQCKRSGFIF
nr:Uncharacterised protein [Klebsiella pneumoniae]